MTEPRVFLIHGFEGAPNGGWRPWLMAKLGRNDIYACALPMPDPNDPQKNAWVDEIRRTVGVPDENVFFVGHSLGVPAILRYLETLHPEQKIGGAVLVSGPILHALEPNDERMKTFFETPFDFSLYKKVCKNFSVIQGDNDPWFSFDQAETLARELSCALIPIPNGGHLNGSSGHYELPEAFVVLMNFLKLSA